MDAAGILTMVLGAVFIAAGAAHGDPGGTLAGAVVYTAGLHWPRHRIPGQDTRNPRDESRGPV